MREVGGDLVDHRFRVAGNGASRRGVFLAKPFKRSGAADIKIDGGNGLKIEPLKHLEDEGCLSIPPWRIENNIRRAAFE